MMNMKWYNNSIDSPIFTNMGGTYENKRIG